MWGGRMDQYAAATVNRRLAAISGLFAFVAMRDPEATNTPVVVRDLAAWRSRTWSGHRVILLGCVDASGSSGSRGPQRRGRRVGGRERQAAGSDGRPVCRTGATFWSMIRRSSFGRWVLGVHDHWKRGYYAAPARVEGVAARPPAVRVSYSCDESYGVARTSNRCCFGRLAGQNGGFVMHLPGPTIETLCRCGRPVGAEP